MWVTKNVGVNKCLLFTLYLSLLRRLHIHMSFHIDNIVVCTQIEHILSTKSLYEIHLCILILLLLHVHSHTMEDNPLLVDMCWVVILSLVWLLDRLIALTHRHPLWCIHPIIQLSDIQSFYIHSHLIIIYLSCAIY